ncbi:hypothetical protein Anapl_07431 [Anas platyrhynchos]|uniref:Uncharacterized protein n=1 Tax=Anas platyrhynchos TaxID=8839 RepID=R0JG50_ANAPL|nr:hypothetical protein Anapl_07431 [Anas platyrhynchos]
MRAFAGVPSSRRPLGRMGTHRPTHRPSFPGFLLEKLGAKIFNILKYQAKFLQCSLNLLLHMPQVFRLAVCLGVATGITRVFRVAKHPVNHNQQVRDEVSANTRVMAQWRSSGMKKRWQRSGMCGELTWPSARGAARCCRKAGSQDGALCEPPVHSIFPELPWDRDHHSAHFWWAATTLHNGHNLPKALSQDCTKDIKCSIKESHSVWLRKRQKPCRCKSPSQSLTQTPKTTTPFPTPTILPGWLAAEQNDFWLFPGSQKRGGVSLKGASHHIIWLLLGLLQGVPMPQTSCTALHPPRQKSPALSSPGMAELAEGRISACQLISSKARLQKENMPKMSYVTHLHKYVLKISESCPLCKTESPSVKGNKCSVAKTAELAKRHLTTAMTKERVKEDTETTEVTLISDVHFSFIFSEQLRITQNQAASRLKGKDKSLNGSWVNMGQPNLNTVASQKRAMTTTLLSKPGRKAGAERRKQMQQDITLSDPLWNANFMGPLRANPKKGTTCSLVIEALCRKRGYLRPIPNTMYTIHPAAAYNQLWYSFVPHLGEHQEMDMQLLSEAISTLMEEGQEAAFFQPAPLEKGCQILVVF